MDKIQPTLDFLVIQMDGDVSRKEKVSHCGCGSVKCPLQNIRNPLECDIKPEYRNNCPVLLPCPKHNAPVSGYMEHLKSLIRSWLKEIDRTCIAIPCDSTEAWIAAAYDNLPEIEFMENPWENVIAKKKIYHGIRISGKNKRARIFEQFAPVVCKNWDRVTELCLSAREFERDISLLGR